MEKGFWSDMTEAEQQGAAFWEGIDWTAPHVHPYTIMFMVNNNCPVYMHDYREWVEYFVASHPSDTHTEFVFEGQANLLHVRVLVKFMAIYDYTMDILKDQGDWLEHNGVTTA